MAMPTERERVVPRTPKGPSSRTQYLDAVIARQWHMTPLDIIASAAAPLDSAATTHQTAVRAPMCSLVDLTWPLRMWWRRSLVEPLVGDKDRAVDVWRKAIFCAMVCLIACGQALTLVAGILAMVLLPTADDAPFQQGGYLVLLSCNFCVLAIDYAMVRCTQRLSDWGYFATYAQIAVMVHVVCVLNGPRYASCAVMSSPLLLLVWMAAAETRSVKVAGIAASYVLSVAAYLESQWMLNAPEQPNGNSVVKSRAYPFARTTFQVTLCTFAFSAFGFMLIERHASSTARAASRAIKRITRALLIDDYATVMQLLTNFSLDGGGAVGGSTAAMLARHFEAVADVMRAIRPHIPDHVFLEQRLMDAQRAQEMINPSPAVHVASPRDAMVNDTSVGSLFQPDANCTLGVDPPGRPNPRHIKLSSHTRRSASNRALRDEQRTITVGPSTSVPIDGRPRTVVADGAGDAQDPLGGGHQGDEMGATYGLRRDGGSGVNLVTVVLLTYRGKWIASNPYVLDAALQCIKEANGIVEFVGYSHLLASFFGDTSAHAEATLWAIVQLRALVLQRKLLSVSAHQGNAWVGVCKARTRRWRFVGGIAVEMLWRMPSVAQHTAAACVATEGVVAPRREWCCPIDVVAIDPAQRESVAEIIYEVHGSDCRGTVVMDAQDTTSRLVRANFNVNRLEMYEVTELLSSGKLRRAAQHMRCLRDPSAHMLRLQEAISSAIRRGKHVFYKKWLGWGTLGTPAAVHDVSTEDSIPASCSSYSLFDDSRTSLASAVSPAMALETQNASISVYDRVASNILERRRKIEVTAGEDALFEMFVTPDSGQEIPSYIVDHANRKWLRGQRTFGHGAFGRVFSATGVYGDIVAIKCLDLENRAISARAEEVSKEIHTLSELRHENIVGYIGDCLHGHHYFIVMEAVPGGSLADLLAKFKVLPAAAVARYVRDALEGLRYLHRHRVLHCDIKPPNILITGSGQCKLADFGSAVNLALVHEHQKRAPSTTSEGTSHHQLQTLRRLTSQPSNDCPGATHPDNLTQAFVPLDPSRNHALSWKQPSLLSQSEEPLLERSSLVSGCLYQADGAAAAAPLPDGNEQAEERRRTSQPVHQRSSVATSALAPDDAGDGTALVARGTPQYMAPEACRNEGLMASDVWSLGITTYQLLLGRLPWRAPFGSQQDAMFVRQLGNHPDPLSEIEWQSLHDTLTAGPLCNHQAAVNAVSFVRACLVVDAQRRPSVDELLSHPFLAPSARPVATDTTVFVKLRKCS